MEINIGVMYKNMRINQWTWKVPTCLWVVFTYAGKQCSEEVWNVDQIIHINDNNRLPEANSQEKKTERTISPKTKGKTFLSKKQKEKLSCPKPNNY